MTTIPTDLALAQTPTENASETPRLRETQAPDTATEGVCCQQRSCSALDNTVDVEVEGLEASISMWDYYNSLDSQPDYLESVYTSVTKPSDLERVLGAAQNALESAGGQMRVLCVFYEYKNQGKAC